MGFPRMGDQSQRPPAGGSSARAMKSHPFIAKQTKAGGGLHPDSAEAR